MTWEYIAGFIDGEGAIVKRKLAYNLYISQTNFEVLDEIRKFAGVGLIHAIGKRKSHWKDAWMYNAGGARGTYHILSNVVDHLIVKRAWAITVMDKLEARLREIDQEKNLKIRRIRQAKLLRQQGLTYRKIAKLLGTDHGYVRRLVLSPD